MTNTTVNTTNAAVETVEVVANVVQPTPEVFPGAQALTLEQIQAMIASGQIQVIGSEQQQPQPEVAKASFMNLLGKVKQKPQVLPQQEVAPQPQQEETFTYEYVEITDLCLPKLTAEEKKQAIELANQIEKLKVSIHKRQQDKIVVSDTEFDNLNKLLAEYKRLTGSSIIGSMRLATRGAKVKLTQSIGKVESKTLQLVDDIEEVSCAVVDDVVELGKATLDFAGVATKGVIGITGTATKGILKAGFNLVK